MPDEPVEAAPPESEAAPLAEITQESTPNLPTHEQLRSLRSEVWSRIGRGAVPALRTVGRRANPIVRTVSFARDAKHIYEEVQEFRQEWRERERERAEEERDRNAVLGTNTPKPYYQVKEAEREAYIQREQAKGHERDHEAIYRTGTLTDTAKGVHEVLSKRGNDYQNALNAQERLTEAKTVRAQVEQNFYQTHSPQERYQYLMTSIAEKNGGIGSFDRVYLPDRAVWLDKTTAEQMYRDGFEFREIRQAIIDKSPNVPGLHSHSEDANLIPQYITATAGHLDRDTSLLHDRMAVAQWRVENGIPRSDRRHPEEVLRAKDQQHALYRNEQNALLQEHAWAVLREPDPPGYRGEVEREYSKDLAPRIIQHGVEQVGGNYDRQFQTDVDIAKQLRLAGYELKDVQKEFDHISSNSSRETGYGNKVVQDFATNPDFLRDFSNFRAEMSQKGLSEERRLDKLGLDYISRQEREMGIQQQPTAQPSMSQTHTIEPSR